VGGCRLLALYPIQKCNESSGINAPYEDELVILHLIQELPTLLCDFVGKEVRRSEVAPIVVKETKSVESVNGHMPRFQEMLQFNVAYRLPVKDQGVSGVEEFRR